MTLRKSLLFTALVLTGCGRGMTSEAEFRSGLPTQEMVQVKSPGTQSTGIKQSQALLSSAAVRALGKNQESSFYELTRGATSTVNGATLNVLALVKGVTQYPPTTVSESSAVWGPHSEALNQNEWRLTVTKTADNTYDYTLSARDKTDANAPFLDVLTGTQTAAVDSKGEAVAGFGQGEFTLSWDKIRMLPDNKTETNVGSLNVKYARPDATSAVTVDAKFIQVKDDSGKIVDVDYGYASTPGQGGQFDFKEIADAYKPSGSSSSQLETLTIKSRWTEEGAGRSDIKLAGGDLPGEATVNDCWDTRFLSQFMRTSYAPTDTNSNYGVEATDCAFTSAVYSSL